jgi:superfamily II DNA helicase RecQ
LIIITYKKCSNEDCENPWLPDTNEYFYGQWYTTKHGKIYKLEGQCKNCRRKKQLKYKRENPDKVKESEKKWYKENKNKKLTYFKNWRSENRERWDQLMKEYQQSEIFKNEKSSLYRNNRKNKKHEINKKEWRACKDYFHNECAYCGLSANKHLYRYGGELKLFGLHKEHVVHDGKNDLSNCVPSCRDCNSYKSAIPFEVWYNEDNPSFAQERYERIINWLTEDYKLHIDHTKKKRKKTQ